MTKTQDSISSRNMSCPEYRKVWLDCRAHATEQDYAESVNYFQRTNVSTRQLKELGWSDARIKAFKNREKNPNQYYYRFNDPGEPQATGKWSAKDKALFLKLINEKGVDYQVGAECAIHAVVGHFFDANSRTCGLPVQQLLPAADQGGRDQG